MGAHGSRTTSHVDRQLRTVVLLVSIEDILLTKGKQQLTIGPPLIFGRGQFWGPNVDMR